MYLLNAFIFNIYIYSGTYSYIKYLLFHVFVFLLLLSKHKIMIIYYNTIDMLLKL